MGMQ
jgi:chromosome segregation ATPase